MFLEFTDFQVTIYWLGIPYLVESSFRGRFLLVTDIYENELNDYLLMQKILDKNIEVAKMQLEEGIGEEETKAEIDRVRDRLRIYREIRNTPEDQIKRLTVEEDEEINPDPFATEVDNDNQSS